MNLLEEIKRLRELAAKATPGPWDIKHHQGAGNLFRLDNPMSANEFMATSDFNLALIAASRTAIPTLCDALEKAEKVLRELLRTGAYDPSMPEWSTGRDEARALLKEWRIE